MAENVTPYKDSEKGKKAQVTEMFDNISGGYDGMNRVITFGVDKSWRRKVVKLVGDARPETVLDIATGTADLAILVAKRTNAPKITGIDISEGMLEVGRKKVAAQGLSARIGLLIADSENLPFEDNSFDAITVGFGIRNFENLEKGLSEILRVLKPGGIFAILETSVPTAFPFKQGYRFYTHCILPLIGKLFSKDRAAYAYLSQSASVFPHGEALNNILRKIGFIDVAARPQTFGVASIYTASKKA
jgi:demethylmenaquinone methyltransferase/2-methoxy-6-polyprenyl-1,4-benzoquinol methylase